MNLHTIAGPAVAAVNPMQVGSLRVSSGSVLNPDYSRTPTFQQTDGLSFQVQPMTYKDLMQVDGLNLNGEKRGIYVKGRVDGLVRPENKGGDLIWLPHCVFTGSIAGTLLTVESVVKGALRVGDVTWGPGAQDGTVIQSFGTGSGGVGTYVVNKAQTVSSTQMSFGAVWLVVLVLEAWKVGWTKVAAVLQNSQ